MKGLNMTIQALYLFLYINLLKMRNTKTILVLLCALSMTIQSYSQPKSSHLTDPPAWASEAIWYQIFVERFCNGDTTNDPSRTTLFSGTDFFRIPDDWTVTPWTKNWYSQEDWAVKTGGTLDQTLQLRRYGGDLQGILNKLDYLADLGINAIYLNPVNDAPSLHKYDARNYHHIDVNFGPDPEGDLKLMADENPADPATWKWTSADTLFLKLVDEVHKRNMRIIIDYSWNHTGVEFWAFKDLVKNQERSAYKNWYNVTQYDDPSTPENEFKYEGWLGISSLPEIRKVDITTERKIGHPYEGDINPDARQHIFDVTRRWLAPNGDPGKGIDGYRLDVADHIGMKFWRDYHSFVKSIKPDAYLVGEIWWESYPNRFMNPVPYTSGDVFDAIMFYQAYRPAKYFFSRSNFSIDARQLRDSLQYQWSRLEKPFRYSMMNVASTHDTPRLLTCFDNPGKYKYKAKPQDDPDYKTGKPSGETLKRVNLYLIHQYTSIGAPHIWNGDEMGMWGSDDPDCRKPIWWPELQFESESRYDENGKPVYTNRVGFNAPLHKYYKTLIKIRKENPILSHGDIRFLEMEGKAISYKRFDANSEIIVLLNAGYEGYKFHVPKGTYLNLLTNKNLNGTEIDVAPLSGMILKKAK